MFKFERVWSSEAVRKACIKFDWYTQGSSEEYSYLLGFVDSHKPTDKNITWVVEDIFNHSDTEGRDLGSVAFCVGSFVVSLRPVEK